MALQGWAEGRAGRGVGEGVGGGHKTLRGVALQVLLTEVGACPGWASHEAAWLRKYYLPAPEPVLPHQLPCFSASPLPGRSDEALATLLCQLPQLRSLVLDRCLQAGDRALQAVSKHVRHMGTPGDWRPSRTAKQQHGLRAASSWRQAAHDRRTCARVLPCCGGQLNLLPCLAP